MGRRARSSSPLEPRREPVLGAALGLSLLIAAFCGPVVLADTWAMPTPYGESAFHTVNIRRFAEDLQAISAGRIQIEVHSGGALYRHAHIVEAVRSGSVPIGEFLLARLGGDDAVFEVDSLPFLATNYRKARKLWEASRSAIEARLAGQGLIVLFVVPWTPQGIFASRPLDGGRDLQGLRLRVYNPSTERFARLAGSTPVKIATAKLGRAFRDGRLQAMLMSMSTGVRLRVWEFASHFYHVRAWLPKSAVVVNRQVFEALSEPARAALRDAARFAEERGWRMSEREMHVELETLASNGVAVSRPSDRLRIDLNKIGRQMALQWTERAGDPGIEIIEAFYALD